MTLRVRFQGDKKWHRTSSARDGWPWEHNLPKNTNEVRSSQSGSQCWQPALSRQKRALPDMSSPPPPSSRRAGARPVTPTLPWKEAGDIQRNLNMLGRHFPIQKTLLNLGDPGLPYPAVKSMIWDTWQRKMTNSASPKVGDNTRNTLVSSHLVP